MKTALQEAIEKFEHALAWEVEGKRVDPYSWTAFSNDLYELLEKEKQQMEDSFNKSRLTHPMIGFKHPTFEEYYNETFKN